MSGSSNTNSFKRFALELYRRAGVADACLDLQNRHDLDVNVVLFAGFVGAAQRQTLTIADLDLAHRRVDAWHQEVVRPLRTVRQRLKTGPVPAPSEATGALRRKLAQLEIDAEIIELDQLGALIPELRSASCVGSAAAPSVVAATTEHGRHDALVSSGGTYTCFDSDGCGSADRSSKITVGLRRSNRF
jgi:uncharacterized protein (TIGR02444 family)